MKIEEFLSPEEEQSIADAISLAEKSSSGEIRVHLDKSCKNDALVRAKDLFKKLKMYETAQRNAVIIYISVDDHKLAIYGDEGIHTIVEQNFWDEDIELMVSHFKDGRFLDGILAVVGRIGVKLKEHFPHDELNDINELDNSVSYGDNL
jgi:uncharacterized membrane protein